MLHLVFKTYNTSRCNLMEYLRENGFRTAIGITANIDDIHNQYEIVCYGGKDFMKNFDPILVKLATGATLINHWEVDEGKY